LTQPRHAITVPRGGGPGYPQSRKVFATWNKPIVVLCNQNSYSNAEIFTHAIKLLGRGRVVGVPTAGGVVSTGAVRIMDLGVLRFPFRGWFVLDTGEDMEMNGAVPDVIVWPAPGELPRGVDKQLEKAVELLKEDVAAWQAKPRPQLRRATQR
jgi:tricorn protease